MNDYAWEVNYQKKQAFKLARWLLEEQGVKKPKAYIIAAKKYKLDNWHDVQKLYNLYVRSRQQKLF